MQELLALWRHRPPSNRDFHEIEEIFPAASYQFVLYGMGFRPEAGEPRRLDDPQAAARSFQSVAELTRKYLAGLPSNRDLLNHVRANGLRRV